jgi:hypothetical protein
MRNLHRFPPTLKKAYESEGRDLGMTVQEWESWVGLPPFSVYPEAREARSWRDRGVFMYRNATDEERAQMDAERPKKARAAKASIQ